MIRIQHASQTGNTFVLSYTSAQLELLMPCRDLCVAEGLADSERIIKCLQMEVLRRDLPNATSPAAVNTAGKTPICIAPRIKRSITVTFFRDPDRCLRRK